MKWWQRLGLLMRAQGLSVDAVAASSGIPVKSIYGYLKGAVDNPRGTIIADLAAALGVTEQDLRYGSEVAHVVALKRIPLLDLNKLGTLDRDQSPLRAWDGVTFVSVPDDGLGEKAFAVRLTDDSGAPDFEQNEVVICNPDAPVAPGKMVIAVLDEPGGALFRRYRPAAYDDPSRFRLIAPNPDYPDIDVSPEKPGRVIARAVKHIRDI